MSKTVYNVKVMCSSLSIRWEPLFKQMHIVPNSSWAPSFVGERIWVHFDWNHSEDGLPSTDNPDISDWTQEVELINPPSWVNLEKGAWDSRVVSTTHCYSCDNAPWPATDGWKKTHGDYLTDDTKEPITRLQFIMDLTKGAGGPTGQTVLSTAFGVQVHPQNADSGALLVKYHIGDVHQPKTIARPLNVLFKAD